jgi:hypothetical protein
MAWIERAHWTVSSESKLTPNGQNLVEYLVGEVVILVNGPARVDEWGVTTSRTGDYIPAYIELKTNKITPPPAAHTCAIVHPLGFFKFCLRPSLHIILLNPIFHQKESPRGVVYY